MKFVCVKVKKVLFFLIGKCTSDEEFEKTKESFSTIVEESKVGKNFIDNKENILSVANKVQDERDRLVAHLSVIISLKATNRDIDLDLYLEKLMKEGY